MGCQLEVPVLNPRELAPLTICWVGYKASLDSYVEAILFLHWVSNPEPPLPYRKYIAVLTFLCSFQ